MEEERCGFMAYHAQAPYPAVRAMGRNQRYAEAMLGNIGSANSEMSAVGLYFYDHLVTAEIPEVSEVFHKVSMVEMRHLEIFGTLARQLGADPRLWCRQGGRYTWWTPGFLHYSQKLGPLLQVAIRDEQATVRKYQEQCRWIGDQNVVENLQRIIQDERVHLEIFHCLMESYGGMETKRRP